MPSFVMPEGFGRPWRRITGVAGLLLWPAMVMATDGLFWSRDVAVAAQQGDGTALAVSKLELALPWQQLDAREDGFSSGIRVNETRFDWSGTTAADSALYWVGVPLRYYQWRSSTGQLRLQLEPGLMTDGNVTSAEALGTDVLLAWRGLPERGFFWQVGLMVDRRFGDFKPRPQVALAAVAGDTEWLLGFPETRVEHLLQPGWRGWLHIRPDGGVWREQLQGQTQITEVMYRSWRMGAGTGLEWQPGWWLELEAGLQRGRQLEAVDSTQATLRIQPGNNHFWRAGIALHF